MNANKNEIYIDIQYKKNYIYKRQENIFEYNLKKQYKLNINLNLEDNLKDFYYSNGIVKSSKMFFYIINKGKAIKQIDIKQPLSEIINELIGNSIRISSEKMRIFMIDDEINEKGEKIILNRNKKNDNNVTKNFTTDSSNRKIKLTQDIEVFTTKKELGESTSNVVLRPGPKKSNKWKILMVAILIFLILLIILFISLYFYLWNKKKVRDNYNENENENEKKEIFMANINYKKGLGYLYQSEEKSDVISQNGSKSNSHNFIEYKNYLLLILEENKE